MQKIKDLVEVFNGYYEQRDVKVAIAKNDFDAALKAAKLLPAGTKYEEDKKAELIKCLGGMGAVPANEITTNPDTPTDTNSKSIDDQENPQNPDEVKSKPIDDQENPHDSIDETIETTEPEDAIVTDPVEQIVKASEIAETDETTNEPEAVTSEEVKEEAVASTEEVEEETAAPAKKRRK